MLYWETLQLAGTARRRVDELHLEHVRLSADAVQAASREGILSGAAEYHPCDDTEVDASQAQYH